MGLDRCRNPERVALFHGGLRSVGGRGETVADETLGRRWFWRVTAGYCEARERRSGEILAKVAVGKP
jgi:hypothetical protein